MKKLSDFKDEQAIVVVGQLLEPIMTIVTNPENGKFKDEQNGFKMFSGFLANSPKAMMQIFAILSEQDTETYHCDGVEVTAYDLAADQESLILYTCYPFDEIGLTSQRFFVYADYTSGVVIDKDTE